MWKAITVKLCFKTTAMKDNPSYKTTLVGTWTYIFYICTTCHMRPHFISPCGSRKTQVSLYMNRRSSHPFTLILVFFAGAINSRTW